MNFEKSTLETVKEYYGTVLKTNQDLKTSACCSVDALPAAVRELQKLIHPEVAEKFYGCGLVIPQELEGQTVLDLGCGSGRDVFLLSKLVGESGQVIGIDMTEAQLAVARRHEEYHAKKFGYSKPNTRFVQGYIEDLETAGIASNSVDIVVSNCVFNLSPDKPRVFREIFRVLKPGGELFFSDVFTDRRLPPSFKQDPVLLGECLGGALYLEDFRRTLLALGCRDFRTVARAAISITDPAIQAKVGLANFTSHTLRAFKLDIEDKCEDYGQVAYYLGTIPGAPHAFRLDDHHLLEKGRPMTVCSNTAAMLGETRYAKHFRITGDLSTHFGLFPCAPTPVEAGNSAPTGACC